jgi:anti-sigma factor RsiW
MQCNECKEQLFEVVTGAAGPEVTAHFTSCAECAAELESMRKTMALLDDWKAPEDTSPYFMTRLMARVREEATTPAQASGWLTWFRKPAFALSLAAVLVAGVLFLRPTSDIVVPAAHTCAVTDLQFLDKNNDVLQNLEVLDDIQGGSANSAATPASVVE